MEFILDILYLYVVIYTIYFLVLSIRNLNDKPFRISKRYAQFEEKDNIAVIIYAHNNKNTLENLIKELKSQDYPIENFKMYVLLDNCVDGSEQIFEHEPYITLINIKDVGTIGKDMAVSRLLENLSTDETIDSYLFIDADRSIPSDFLSTVNAALSKHAVLSGETLMVTDTLGPIDKIKAAYQKYHMNFMRQARSLLGLAATADSGVFIIKKEIVDRIGNVDFKNVNTELKYSLMLSKIKFQCSYNSNIQTFVDTTNYTFKKPRLSVRLDLFKKCFPKIFTSNKIFAEHTFSLLNPNIWTVLFIYALVLKHSYLFKFIVDFKFVVFSFILLILAFCVSLVNAKLTTKEICLLCLYPFYSICHIVKNLPPVRMLKNKFKNNGEDISSGTEKMVVDVLVDVGETRQIPCKLEFISEFGLAKIRFIYKKRKFTTNSHIRMIDALQELKMKLIEYNFVIRICDCCKHFRSCQDGTTNMLKGICNNEFPSLSVEGEKNTLIWNTCSEFEPADIKSAVEEFLTEKNDEPKKQETPEQSR